MLTKKVDIKVPSVANIITGHFSLFSLLASMCKAPANSREAEHNFHQHLLKIDMINQ